MSLTQDIMAEIWAAASVLEMTNIDQWSIKRIARLAGILSIGSGFPDGFAVYVIKSVLVPGNAAATAMNILAHETLFRAGIVAEIFALVVFAVSLLLLYLVFKPASRRGALLFLIVAMMGATIQAIDVLGDITALTFLKGGTGAAALSLVESQAMAYLFVRMHVYIYTVALAFTGFGSLFLAYAATRASFLPRISGYFLAIDGIGYITHSFGTLLAPAMIAHIQPYVPYMTAILGTGALMIWLIIKGINVERWNEQAAESALLR
jgi:hypothetical protein